MLNLSPCVRPKPIKSEMETHSGNELKNTAQLIEQGAKRSLIFLC